MGVIKGFFLVIVSIIFFISLLVFGILLNLSLSLKYDNLRTQLVPLMTTGISQIPELSGALDSSYPLVQIYCQTNSQYVFNYGNYSIIFPCDIVNQGKNAMINYAAEQLIHNVYYQQYNCDFFDCFSQGGLPTFLISEHTRLYLLNKVYLLLGFSLVLLALMLLLIKKKSNFPIVAGVLVIIAAIPLLKLNIISSFFPVQVRGLISVFFSSSSFVFYRMLIAGAVLVAFGVLAKIFGIGERIEKFFERKKGGEEKGKSRKKS